MKLTPAVIELVVSDMPATLAFYRHLGLDIPADADTEPHVDLSLGGVRLAFDTPTRSCPSTPRGPHPPAVTGPPWVSRATPRRRSTRHTPSWSLPARAATSSPGTRSGA